MTTYQPYQLSQLLDGVDHVSRSVVEERSTLIQERLDRLGARYRNPSRAEGSGNPIKDSYKKIEYSVSEEKGQGPTREA